MKIYLTGFKRHDNIQAMKRMTDTRKAITMTPAKFSAMFLIAFFYIAPATHGMVVNTLNSLVNSLIGILS